MSVLSQEIQRVEVWGIGLLLLWLLWLLSMSVAPWILLELLLLRRVAALILLRILVLLGRIVALVRLLLEMIGSSAELLWLLRVPIVVARLKVLVLVEVVVALLLHKGLTDGVERIAAVGWSTLVLLLMVVRRMFDLHGLVSLSLTHRDAVYLTVVFV